MKLDENTKPMAVHATVLFALNGMRHETLKRFRDTGDLSSANWPAVNALNAAQCAASDYAQHVHTNKIEMDPDSYVETMAESVDDFMLSQEPDLFNYWQVIRAALLTNLPADQIAKIRIVSPAESKTTG